MYRWQRGFRRSSNGQYKKVAWVFSKIIIIIIIILIIMIIQGGRLRVLKNHQPTLSITPLPTIVFVTTVTITDPYFHKKSLWLRSGSNNMSVPPLLYSTHLHHCSQHHHHRHYQNLHHHHYEYLSQRPGANPASLPPVLRRPGASSYAPTGHQPKSS